MKMHAASSETILSRIAAFKDLAAIAGAHHERLDGKGYPRGLKGDQILPETRIISTADVFDALTADRPYRAAMPVSKAPAIMAEGLGTATDPGVFHALRRAMERVDPALAARRRAAFAHLYSRIFPAIHRS
jgi:HD-GYP domain-containing protein (c-di-GMP phosphodiesterase class II)